MLVIGLAERPGSNLLGGETLRHFFLLKNERIKHICRRVR